MAATNFEIHQYHKIRRCAAALCVVELLEENKRSWTRGKTRPWMKKRKEKGYFTNIVKELRMEDTAGYKEMMRMSYDNFQTLLRYIEKDITPCQVSGGHKVITAAERLTLTIRFLATGESYRSLSFQFRISRSAISYIVKNVCDAINDHVQPDYMKVPSKKREWLHIAKKFNEKWQYPHCLGAIDGKHVVVQQPPNSGSYFYNYKHTHSIVVLAVAGPDYECLYADIGTNGRVSDGGIWNKCGLALAIEDNKLSLPSPEYLAGCSECLPFVLVGDDAFALKLYFMKPYP
ncbi:protein ANTAGONIST OF LIKE HETEROCHROMATIN PROTEIN 1-like [Xenia sp. Carnegie-2017]|uniref:protein ANTAGONIST OF LIKE HETEROCHROMATIN PROTEIN 1-like n=1 Tax=Xenia sp. Carnegie-2017 TaxID=2897299 RepID=UPI001F04A67A|nr:protein ANTAGONIST OF LIKE HETEROCHROMATIN PROTEIN 1-like [Xenia sp. Carnegie-2017]